MSAPVTVAQLLAAPVPVLAAPEPTPAPPITPSTVKLEPNASLEAVRFDQIGREHAGKQDFQSALAMMNRAIELNPGYARAFNARGYVHLRLTNYPQAMADFTEALRLDPTYANAYHNRSVTRKLVGEVAGAASDARNAKKHAASVAMAAVR